MTSSFCTGQLLRGRVSTYVLTKQIHASIWLATNESKQTVIVKSCLAGRLIRERDILQRFQSRAPLRPLLDEIEDGSDSPSLVLKHLDDDLMRASATKRLTSPEIKQVARSVLEALKVLHEDGYVHTDIKLDNVLVNYGQNESRFTEVELADCGDTVHKDSKYPKEGVIIGAPIWRSPEAHLQMPWGTSTDIWSFGAVLISLIWGDDWHIFNPKVSFDDPKYEFNILMRQNEFFGPFPPSYNEIADEEVLFILGHVMSEMPPEKMKPFHRLNDPELSKEDKAFVLKIMKLDPRDRPTAKELLEDEWFKVV